MPAGRARARGAARAPHLRAALQPQVAAYLSSASDDRELVPHDIRGSLAHVRGLREAGLLTAAEANALNRALRQVLREARAGSFTITDQDEDVHMAVERRVTELEPEIGPRLHTGRSRNDQVALDLRLWTRATAAAVAGDLAALITVMAARALEEASTLMPGYTHLQRAQPVTLGHHLLAYCEMFTRDAERCRDAHQRAGRSPLGAAALAGSTLPLVPDVAARELGLEAPRNSLDAVSDRDFLLDLSHALLTVAIHLSRLGEEVVLWCSTEFGFARLPDRLATGSSLMPQKRNPDVAELLRGRTGEVLGALVSMATVLKGLPLAYNRDLQERQSIFRAASVVRAGTNAARLLIEGLEFDRARLAAAAADPALLATDAADALVLAGMPFREAHAAVALEFSRRSGEPSAGRALESLRQRQLPGSPQPARVRREAMATLRRAEAVGRWAAERAS